MSNLIITIISIVIIGIAVRQGKPLAALIAEIDAARGTQGLSSAIRVYVLKTVLLKVGI